MTKVKAMTCDMEDFNLRQELRTALAVLDQIQGLTAMGGDVQGRVEQARLAVEFVEAELDKRVTAKLHQYRVQAGVLENRSRWAPLDLRNQKFIEGMVVFVCDSQLVIPMRGADVSVVGLDFPAELGRSMDVMGVFHRMQVGELVRAVRKYRERSSREG